jgi:hypothetical protein
MRFNHDGITLWYGTPDAPAPSETAQSGSEIPVTVGVQPIDASNKVEVLYRINQGPTQAVAAKWWRNDAYGKAQYFRARLPAFRAGETVEYTAICRCAGRQVPSLEEARRFVSSFRIVGGEARPTTTLASKEISLPKLDILTSSEGSPIEAVRPATHLAAPATIASILPQQLPQPTFSTLPLRSAEVPRAQTTCPGVPWQLGSFRGCRTGGIGDSNTVQPQWVSVDLHDMPVIAEGLVRTSFVSHEDVPFNHDSHDWNFDVKLDTQYEYFLSDANHQEENGECWMEMEWEIRYFPTQFWPVAGDRVWMMGRWVFDCGHPPYESEIHPPQAVAFTRREPTFFPGDWAPSPTNKTFIYLGTPGRDPNAHFSAPLLRDYEFDIDLPPKPSSSARFHAEIVEQPYGGPVPILTPLPDAQNPARLHVRVPLDPANTRYVFSWEDVPGRDTDAFIRFIDSWKQEYGVYRLDTTRARIEKVENNRILRISSQDVLNNVYFVDITLDVTRTIAILRYGLTGGPAPPDYYRDPDFLSNYLTDAPRSFLQAKMENGKLNIYAYDPLPQDYDPNFKYGAVVAAGWREPITTQGFRVLRVTVDSILIRNSHHVSVGINLPGEPAKWRLWVRVGSTWMEVAALDNVRGGDTVPINKTVLVVVPEDGSLSLQTTGWVVGAIDNLLGQPFPGLASGLWEYVFGDLGTVPPRANQRIGIVSAEYTAAENFGIGIRGHLSARNGNPGVGGDTENDFVLYYHIDELAKIPAGTPIRKRIWITFLSVRARDTQDVNRTARISLDIRMVQSGIFGRASYSRSFDGLDIPLGSTISLPQGWTINLPPLRYSDTMTLDIFISDANKPFPEPPDTDQGPHKAPPVEPPTEPTGGGPVPTEETFGIRLFLNQANNYGRGQRTARSTTLLGEFIEITYRIDVVEEPFVVGGGPPIV